MHQANRPTINEMLTAFLRLPSGANTSAATMTAYRMANAITPPKEHA
jgi:hypothetical protein